LLELADELLPLEELDPAEELEELLDDELRPLEGFEEPLGDELDFGLCDCPDADFESAVELRLPDAGELELLGEDAEDELPGQHGHLSPVPVALFRKFTTSPMYEPCSRSIKLIGSPLL
jgi:hypothetical protein